MVAKRRNFGPPLAKPQQAGVHWQLSLHRKAPATLPVHGLPGGSHCSPGSITLLPQFPGMVVVVVVVVPVGAVVEVVVELVVVVVQTLRPQESQQLGFVPTVDGALHLEASRLTLQ